MKRFLPISVLLIAFGLATVLMAQWQIGPIYPENNRSYRSTPPNYDPFQLNWSTGRFDYVPIPYEPEPYGPNYNPYRFNWYSGRWDYAPIPPQEEPGSQAPEYEHMVPSPPAVGSTPSFSEPNDDGLWSTTRPSTARATAKIEHAQGKIVAMRAVDLYGDPSPHLLLRLQNKDGKTTTVDVGDEVNQTTIFGTGEELHATGPMGWIDRKPVLFADHLTSGKESIPIQRHGVAATTQP